MRGLRSDELSLLLLNQPPILFICPILNLVLSPTSYHVVLGLTAAGSSGPTRDLILRCLDSDQLNSHLLHLLTAPGLFVASSGVWVDQTLTLKPSFEKIAQYIGGACNHLDFKNKEVEEAREELNRWAGMKTNGVIEEILPPGSVNSLTRLILTSAICFEAEWEEPFAASRTTTLYKFYSFYGKPRNVSFMTDISPIRRYVGVFDGFKVLRLPYKQQQGGDNKRVMFSMYFFLPDDKNGLDLLIDKLSSDPRFIDRHVPHKKVEVERLMIPRFETRLDFDHPRVLKERALVLPLSSGHLSEIMVENGDDDRQLYIFHESFIQVDEEGTEAAAVSAGLSCGKKKKSTTSSIFRNSFVQVDNKGTESPACGMMNPVDKEKPVRFVANHPFMFVVREDISGMVIFIGKLINPARH